MADLLQSAFLGFNADWAKPKFDAARSQRIYDFTDVVANDSETCGCCMRFNDTAQSCLGIRRHRISFVKYHKLQLRHISAIGMSRNFALGKFLYLFPDYLYSTFITCI
jgi:hypothetical protein